MLRPLYHLMRADFLERVRRVSFLITLGLSVYLAYLFVPPNHTSYATLEMANHRGIYNSAWIGMLVALMTGQFISFAGFYLVKNAIRRDRDTGVGQIIAATPTTRFQYAAGKWLSNLMVLATMVGVMAISAIVMQLVRGEDSHIDLLVLLAPFLFFALPVMALTAAVAVLFETVPFLTGGLGNVIYFFLWMAGISGEMFVAFDLFGIKSATPSMLRACETAFPDYHAAEDKFSMGFTILGDGKTWSLSTFHWNGLDWTTAIILNRLLLIGLALGITAIASRLFDRFDQSREQTTGRRQRNGAEQMTDARPRMWIWLGVSRLGGLAWLRRIFGPIVTAEVRLMFKGVSRWWYMVAAGLFIAEIASPLKVGREILLPIAWLWPVLLWSSMGIRETSSGTDQLIFSSPRSLHRQFPALWIAGIIVSLLTGGGILVRLAIVGAWSPLLAIAIGAAFIPSLALCLGVWSGTGKLFEVLYVLLWYVGLINHVPALDYAGTTSAAAQAGAHWTFLTTTVVLLTTAYVGRRRQMQQ